MVRDAAQTAMVSELIAKEFEARYTKPADLGPRLDKVLTDQAFRMHRPELRGSTYARVKVPKDATPDTEAAAHALIDQIAAALAGQTGLFPDHLRDTATRVAAGTHLTVESEDYKAVPRSGLEPTYGAALFGIAEIGQVSAPVRTPWGWDLVLWTSGTPARELTRDELAAEAFPELRRSFFQVWVNQLVKSLGLHISVDAEQLARLDEGTP